MAGPLTPTVQINPLGGMPDIMGPPSEGQPLDIASLIKAFTSLAQIQGTNRLNFLNAGMMAPQSRHLGMSGEDITNQKGPYDSGGLDWLHTHDSFNPATGAGGSRSYFPGGEPMRAASMNSANQQQNAWVHNNDPTLSRVAEGQGADPVINMLTAPSPAMPPGGMGSAAWPAYMQTIQQGLNNSLAAIRKSRGMDSPAASFMPRIQGPEKLF